MTGTAKNPTAGRLDGIDALRGVACLWVVVYHFGMYWAGGSWRGWEAVANEQDGALHALVVTACRFGYLGVSLFLVLSGFCLYWPLANKPQAERTLALGSFFRRRAYRLLPPYWASLAVFSALSLVPFGARFVLAPVSLRDVVLHATLAHNLVPEAIWSVNGAYWSLALEWQLYLVFPIAVLVARRLGAAATALAAAGAWIAWQLAMRATGYADVSGQIYGVLFESLPARGFEFAAGMWAAERAASGRAVPRWLLCALVPAFALAVWAVRVERIVSLPIDNLACGVSFAALVLLVMRAPHALLRTRPARALVWIGVVSYSLYLWHQPLVLGTRELVSARVEGLEKTLLVALAVGLPALLVVAFASYRAFEVPAMRRAKLPG